MVKIATPVRYRPSYRQPYKEALLELTDDEMVRLSVINKNASAEPEVIVEVPVMRIQKFTVFQGTIRIEIDMVKYTLEVMQWSRGADFGGTMGGPVGLAISALSENKSGVKKWVDILKEKGIPVQFLGALWVVKVAFGIGGFIILIAVLQSFIS